MTIRAFPKSLLFGSPGSYTIVGQHIEFIEARKGTLPEERGPLSDVREIVNLAFFQSFCHEMSHATMAKLLGYSSRIQIYTKDSHLGGRTIFDQKVTNTRHKFLYLAVGPVVDMLFGSAYLIGVSVLMQSSPYFFRNPFLFFPLLAVAADPYLRNMRRIILHKTQSSTDLFQIESLGFEYKVSAVRRAALAALPGAIAVGVLFKQFLQE